MSMLDILRNALGGDPSGDAEQHFDQAAQHAPPEVLGAGIADAMKSDETPPFGEMIGKMFGQSSPQQQAGVLNQILASLGPAAASAVAGGVLGKLLTPGKTQLTPEEASQVSPAQASEIAAHAERTQPAVVDQVSRFYAEHSGLLKVLGSAALLVTLAKIKQNSGRR